MKLRKILLKRFLITAGVSILLTAVFSTAAFWFIFSSSEKATIKNYAAMVTSLYNKDSRPSRFVEELRSRQEKRGVLHGK